MDAAYVTALEAMVRLSGETELQFLKEHKDAAPLLHVMGLARRDAIEALAAMVKTDPAEIETIRKLQNEVQRFIDLVSYTRQILAAGDQAIAELGPIEKEQLARIVQMPEPGDD